jgi:hypothetical protein
VIVGGAPPPAPRLALEVALAPPQAANQADANAAMNSSRSSGPRAWGRSIIAI